MKNQIKSIIKKIPGIRNLVQKNIELRNELEEARHAAVKVGQKAVDLRLKLKRINGEKINVVFVCHRPAVWESLHSVYDALKADNQFNVSIVAIPNKKELPKLWLNHEIYESEGAEEFWKEYGCINGYNYETKEWLDLRTLNPDYVFFQQPYNITRCEEYKSWNVGQYAKICYVSYFYPWSFDESYDEFLPEDFFRTVSLHFSLNKKDDEYIKSRYRLIDNRDARIFMTGYPRFDGIKNIRRESNIWTDNEHKSFRLVWTPRWTTNEGNCHFFEFKDKIISFCIQNGIELVFRPHPQAFQNWNATGEFSIDEQKEFRQLFENYDNLHIDEQPNYLDLFYSSDCLLTDPSSVVYDYFLTGNPIIYSLGSKKSDRNELLHEGLYEVRSWNEVEALLLTIIEKKDEKREVRRLLKNNVLLINGKEIGKIIKDELRFDSCSRQ